MSLYNILIDPTNKRKRAVAYPGFNDDTETVSGSSKTTFTLTVDIDAEHHIDAWVDGRLNNEVLGHFSRDVNNNQVVFSSAVNVDSEVVIRTYLK